MNEFVDYVLSFYGHGQVYDMGATREEIETAMIIRIKSADRETPFEGDSYDRELVRDIMFSIRKGEAA